MKIMSDFKRVFAGTLACAVLIGAGSVHATMIGINFMSDRDLGAELSSSEIAGAPGVRQANWNNTNGGTNAQSGANGTEADIISPTAGTLVDSDGNSVSTSVSWTSDGTWNTTNGTATADAKLMNGYIDAIGATGTVAIDFSGITYDLYDVYVYFGSDGNGRTGQITDGTTTFSYTTFSNEPSGTGFGETDYIQTTDTGTGFPSSNYAIFDQIVGAQFSVELLRGSNNSGIHAIQIVDRSPSEVPVPSILALLACPLLIVFGVGLRRRT